MNFGAKVIIFLFLFKNPAIFLDSVEWLVQTRQNRTLLCVIITQLSHDEWLFVLVPEVSLHGLAFGCEVVAEEDGVGNGMVARLEMSILRQRAVP